MGRLLKMKPCRMSVFAFEPDTAENKALQKEVQLKLRDHLGPTYNDDILPL